LLLLSLVLKRTFDNSCCPHFFEFVNSLVPARNKEDEEVFFYLFGLKECAGVGAARGGKRGGRGESSPPPFFFHDSAEVERFLSIFAFSPSKNFGKKEEEKLSRFLFPIFEFC
jgi:hypothetical protein